MSVSQVSQSFIDRALTRFDYTLKVRKARTLGLEYALAMQRYEEALGACGHWEAPQKPYEPTEPEGTLRCCTQARAALAACAAAYEALTREVPGA